MRPHWDFDTEQRLAAIDRMEAEFERSCPNPLLEMPRRDGGVGERRAWPRTSVWHDLRIVGWPVLLVGAGALVAWVLFAVGLYRGWWPL
jgi:hypothetical protein